MLKYANFLLFHFSAAAHAVPTTVDKWVVVANPDDHIPEPGGFSSDTEQRISGREYVCSAASVAGSAGWKTIIIGPQLPCCKWVRTFVESEPWCQLTMGIRKQALRLKRCTTNISYFLQIVIIHVHVHEFPDFQEPSSKSFYGKITSQISGQDCLWVTMV